MAPLLIRSRDDWRSRLDEARGGGATVGLVPTMGALHAGHLSLIRRARAMAGFVAVTIYVNPLQFNNAADLDAYPSQLDRDLVLAGEAGADAVFAPAATEMWPEAPLTSVRVLAAFGRLEDLARPGHFDGVATIVAKLLALTGPTIALFGEKDFQQLLVVRRLVADLSLPVAVVGCPTVREPDGLALSTRNARLSVDEREMAPKLYWSLLAGKRAVEEDGIVDPGAVSKIMSEVVATEPQLTLEYAAAVDPADLLAPLTLHGEIRLLVAARLGATRLIDNVAATVPAAAAGATTP